MKFTNINDPLITEAQRILMDLVEHIKKENIPIKKIPEEIIKLTEAYDIDLALVYLVISNLMVRLFVDALRVYQQRNPVTPLNLIIDSSGYKTSEVFYINLFNLAVWEIITLGFYNALYGTNICNNKPIIFPLALYVYYIYDYEITKMLMIEDPIKLKYYVERVLAKRLPKDIEEAVEKLSIYGAKMFPNHLLDFDEKVRIFRHIYDCIFNNFYYEYLESHKLKGEAYKESYKNSIKKVLDYYGRMDLLEKENYLYNLLRFKNLFARPLNYKNIKYLQNLVKKLKKEDI